MGYLIDTLITAGLVTFFVWRYKTAAQAKEKAALDSFKKSANKVIDKL